MTMTNIKDGIYFGLPENEYHAHPALSASGIKNMRMSATDFWAASWMNPRKKEFSSDAMIKGTAYHKRILEGKDVFDECYYAALDVADYPDALVKLDDLKAACKDAELKTGGTKDTLAQRLIEHDAGMHANIWDCIKQDHSAAHEGKISLDADTMRDLEFAAAFIEKHPQLSKAFTGGASEVSIFWTDKDTGVKMKARLDYLKPRAVIDLKTLAPKYGTPFSQNVYRSFAAYSYHTQAAVYVEAFVQAVAHIKAGRVHGDAPQKLIDEMAKCDEPSFFFVFQQTGAAPIANLFKFPRHMAYEIGVQEVKQAQEKFKAMHGKFGDEIWIEPQEPVEFSDDEFPPWAFN